MLLSPQRDGVAVAHDLQVGEVHLDRVTSINDSLNLSTADALAARRRTNTRPADDDRLIGEQGDCSCSVVTGERGSQLLQESYRLALGLGRRD